MLKRLARTRQVRFELLIGHGALTYSKSRRNATSCCKKLVNDAALTALAAPYYGRSPAERGTTVKLYTSVGPNPRVVKMFLAEKGMSLPSVTVDLMGGENRQAPYNTTINPAGQ